MRYLILGASGQLGTAFASLIDPTAGRFANRSDLDLAKHDRIEPFIDETGATRLNINATWPLALLDPFGIAGPDGPDAARDTLLFQLDLALAGR